MINKWADLGHNLGECWVNSDKEITYINIPKNASSFIKACILSTKDHWGYSNKLIKNKENLVILRDPIDRWCSGIAQSLFNSKKYDWPIEDIFNFISVDDHTESQIYFLQGIDITKTTFILVNANLRSNLKNWFNERGMLVDLENIHQYNASIEDDRGEIKNKFINLIESQSELMLKLKKHFQADYELINRVKFYGN
jgi:hypothetical protein